jgi:hypothetical protein
LSPKTVVVVGVGCFAAVCATAGIAARLTVTEIATNVAAVARSLVVRTVASQKWVADDDRRNVVRRISAASTPRFTVRCREHLTVEPVLDYRAGAGVGADT